MGLLHVILIVLASSTKPVEEDGVIVLTETNFDKLVLKSDEMWLVDMHRPKCEQCITLVPEFAKVATQLKGKIKLGKVDCTIEHRVLARYEIFMYPTIMIFPQWDKNAPTKYTGNHTAEAIVEAALEQYEKHSVLPNIPQLTNQAMFDECKNFTICIIVFLPHIYDSSAAERNSYIHSVQRVSARFKSRRVLVYWAQRGDFFKLEDKLVLGFAFPSVVGITLQKQKYAVMRNKFTHDELLSFVDKAITGQYPFVTYKDLPKLSMVNRWDGKDHEFVEEDLYDDL